MRNELKYEFNLGNANSIRALLISNRFNEIYSKRDIFTLYYDDYNLNLFFDSENGISRRKKIRIRFYDPSNGSYQVEYKNKFGNLNWKDFKSINNIFFGESIPLYFSNESLNKYAQNLPSDIEKIYKPKVFIKYSRQYFLSIDGHIRVTIDSDIKSYSAISDGQFIFINRQRSFYNDVLEVKYEANHNPNSSIIENLVNTFNLTLGRSSKYCKAISMI